MKRTEFIQRYSNLVATLGKKINVFPETVFAQAIVESSNGKGEFAANANARNANNLFGIKATKNWTGDVYINPEVKSESNKFRKYDSIEDGLKDYFKFLVANKRYRDAGVFDAANYREQMAAIARAGYAGAGNETHYTNLLQKVGATVSKVLGKAVETVKENKTTFGAGAALAALAAGYLIFSNGKK